MRSHTCPHGSRSQTAILGGVLLMMMAVLAPNAMAGSVGLPVPFVQAISPVSVAPGGNSFTLTVTGANFVNASAVFWNSSQLATTICVLGETDGDCVGGDDRDSRNRLGHRGDTRKCVQPGRGNLERDVPAGGEYDSLAEVCRQFLAAERPTFRSP